eukprot:806564-Rhodomonas_salina.1
MGWATVRQMCSDPAQKEDTTQKVHDETACDMHSSDMGSRITILTQEEESIAKALVDNLADYLSKHT